MDSEKQCTQQTTKGAQCKKVRMAGTLFCKQHQPKEVPTNAQQLGTDIAVEPVARKTKAKEVASDESATSKNEVPTGEDESATSKKKCSEVTKSGEPCKSYCIPGSTKCKTHSIVKEVANNGKKPCSQLTSKKEPCKGFCAPGKSMCTRHLNLANKSETSSMVSSKSKESTCSALTKGGSRCTLRATVGDKCGRHASKDDEKYSSGEDLDESKVLPSPNDSEEDEISQYNITEEELGKINKVFDKAMSIADKKGEIDNFKKEFVLPKTYKRPSIRYKWSNEEVLNENNIKKEDGF